MRVWDAATGTPVGAVLTGHTDWVRAVACARVDGRDVIVSGGTDHTLRLGCRADESAPYTMFDALDLSAPVYTICFIEPNRLVAGTDCGLVCLNLAGSTARDPAR